MKTPFLAAIAATIALGGCAIPPSHLGPALFLDSQEPRAVTEASVASKRGEACGENILGIVAQGDSSIDAAKRNGGITQVTSVDADVSSILGLYSEVCTVVRGN